MAPPISAPVAPGPLFHYAAVELAENEKFDCNLGFSHYSLNAAEVGFFFFFPAKS